jgi:dienelactone hydrolase
MGFCIGGPFIWNLLRRAPNRVVAPCWRSRAGRVRSSAISFYDTNIKGGDRSWSSGGPRSRWRWSTGF